MIGCHAVDLVTATVMLDGPRFCSTMPTIDHGAAFPCAIRWQLGLMEAK
jgi:hypothetical protein